MKCSNEKSIYIYIYIGNRSDIDDCLDDDDGWPGNLQDGQSKSFGVRAASSHWKSKVHIYIYIYIYI